MPQPDTTIEVRDFGPLTHAAIDLRPLTVFVGPSNAGKTYLATLISALHRACDGFPRIPPRGLFITERIPTVPGATHAARENLLTPGRAITCSDLPDDVRDRFRDIIDSVAVDLTEEIKRLFDVEDCTELIRSTAPRRRLHVSLRLREGGQDLWRVTMAVSPRGETAEGVIDDVVLVRADASDAERRALTGRSRQNPAALFEHLIDHAARTGRPPRVHHLPAARSGMLQSHRIIASSLVERLSRTGSTRRGGELPTLSGVTTDFIRSLILYEERTPLDETIRVLADDLERDPLHGEIRARRPVPAGDPEFIYRPQGATEDIRLSRASSMVTELAPVVLLLRGGLEPGDTLIIDEIEAHLHPAAQARLAALLARLVRADVRVVVTTHSDWLLRELGNLMREGELALRTAGTPENGGLTPAEVGVWLFQGQDSGFAVREIPFDEIEGIEPEEYETVAETLYNRSADLQNRLQEAAAGGDTERGD